MDFAVIGTLSSYVKQKNLTFAAKHKIRTGQTLTNANGNFISMNTSTFDKLREAAKASTDQAKQQKLARIKQKLKAGQKLTDEELGFLRVNDTKTYKKAKAADDAREELKTELKKAKSKGEAQEAMTRAMIKASSAAMSELSALGQGGGNISAGGGSVMQAGGEVPNGGDLMSAGGEISAEGNSIQIAGGDKAVDGNQNFTDKNSADKTLAEKNSPAQKTDDDANTPEDIMEKYIWTIRALEDEWAKFTNSKEYKDLPNNLTDKKFLNRRLLDAATAYRRAMTA
ncbi:MAG: hypothetical protein IJL12_00645 [Selenomonadaceae bacterium]|nr:hypothetical protein [Selenomonadaceae bacterium]MBQ6130844.1 hypothetical protein [Selenomonadaceae bacterium]